MHQQPNEPGNPDRPPYAQGPPPTWPPQQPYPPQQGIPYGQQPYPPQYGPPPGPPVRPPRGRGPWVRRHKTLTVLGVIAAIIVVAVIASGGKHPAQPAANTAATSVPTSVPTSAASAAVPAAAAQSSAPAAAAKITYVVTGTAGAAQVTYGPAGTDLNGTVPMHVTRRLGSAAYYSIQAQLQGGGKVTVKIEINGKVISSGTADGGYNIAMAEISQDPITGQWQDTQG